MTLIDRVSQQMCAETKKGRTRSPPTCTRYIAKNYRLRRVRNSTKFVLQGHTVTTNQTLPRYWQPPYAPTMQEGLVGTWLGSVALRRGARLFVRSWACGRVAWPGCVLSLVK